MHDDDCEDEGLELPPFGVFHQKNSDEKPTVIAMFRDPLEANEYIEGYRPLNEDEFVTVQTPCCDEPGVFHIVACIYNKRMHVVEVEPGKLAAVPKEMAPMYGDKWVTQGRDD